ncbi:MAG: 4-hydroxy-3-methylbut-2-enyl diphosphate reductase [Pseudomonadota bacterium]|nr:4-hydroxy-3-methylbut-2-enyl diphosphate reductase [Pseudomonadota bacterium]
MTVENINHKTKTIILAEPRGFCAGVDRAVRIVEEALIKFGAPIYVRHEIVHNKHVVNRLAAMGAIFVDELDEIPDGEHVVFSAHGVAKAVVDEAARRNMIAVDATCPLVTKVHVEAARHHQDGAHILLIGHAGHPEVEGTMGQVKPDAMTLIETVADAKSVMPADTSQLAYATQTTLSVDDTADIIAVLRERFPDIKGPRGEDICYATTNRQQAVKDIAGKSDLVLVIGAENSSNSKRLVEVAERFGAKEALLIAHADVMIWPLVDDAETIGITAGASAPEELVEDVIAAIAGRYQITIDRHISTTESVTFNIPSILRS